MAEHALHDTGADRLHHTSVYPLTVCVDRLRDLHDAEAPRQRGIRTWVNFHDTGSHTATFTILRVYRGYHEIEHSLSFAEVPVRVVLRIEGRLHAGELYGPATLEATITTGDEGHAANTRVLWAMIALACLLAAAFHFITEVVLFAAFAVVTAVAVFRWLPAQITGDYRRALIRDIETALHG